MTGRAIWTGRRPARRRGLLGAVAALMTGAVVMGAAPAAACGAETDCVVGADRAYRILMPETADGPVGALIFAHGYRGDIGGAIRNRSLAALAAERGMALISVKSADDDWSIPGAPSSGTRADVDEVAYFDAVLDDAVARFDLDPDRIVATGFSAGAMMVWTLACERAERFAGFAPISGVFWRPTPERCASAPGSVVHIHGDGDGIVPLAGREVGDARQGDVRGVIEMYARHGGFGAPDTTARGDLRCEERRNTDGEILDFCLFSGGHSFSTRYVRHGLDRLTAAGRL